MPTLITPASPAHPLSRSVCFAWVSFARASPRFVGQFSASVNSCAKAGGLGAQVAMVAPIGIFYVAGEGKNRVAFLARHGVEFMPCTLYERSYPAADRLRIVTVREGPMRCWLCVLDDEFVVTIPYPEFTLPILRAYGVQEAGWMASYPLQATVMNSFRLQPGESDHTLRSLATKPLSFTYLKRREAEAQSAPELMTSLLSHGGLKLDLSYLRHFIIAVAAVLLTGALLHWLQIGEEFQTAFIALGIGCLMGGASMLMLPVARRSVPLPAGALAQVAADGSGSTVGPTTRQLG